MVLVAAVGVLAGCAPSEDRGGAKVFPNERFEFPVVWETPIVPGSEEPEIRISLEADGTARLTNMPIVANSGSEEACPAREPNTYTGEGEWDSVGGGVIEIEVDDGSAEIHAGDGRFGSDDWMDPTWYLCEGVAFDLALRSTLKNPS